MDTESPPPWPDREEVQTVESGLSLCQQRLWERTPRSPGGAARTVPPGDLTRLAEALMSPSKDAARREAMSAAGAADAARYLTREGSPDALLALLVRDLEHRSR
jgi:hypothetical protein